jgi:hypothetical protein
VSRIAPKLPLAALIALGVCLLASTATLVGSRLRVHRDRTLVIFIGDSFTNNYRFDEGQRLEDLLARELGDAYQVFNLARAGARPLDLLLQIHRGELILGRVHRVVLPLTLDKLVIPDPRRHARLDKRGDNLKWLSLTTASRRTYSTFDGELWRKLVVHKLGLLFGFYDALEEEFVEHLQSPWERDRMRRDSPRRRRAIQRKTRELAAFWDQLSPAQRRLDNAAGRDLGLTVAYPRQRGIPLLVALLPVGNMDVVRAEFTPRARANLEALRQASLAWCRQQGVPCVDLTQRLPGAHYDDFTHLRHVAGNQIIVDAVKGFAATGVGGEAPRRSHE